MTPFHIAFILINLAIPGYIFFNSSESSDTPKIKWGPFEKQLEQVIDASGGFDNCASGDVVQYIRNLCERSMDKFKGNDSIVIERASADLVYSCESRNDATFVQWRIEPTEDADLPCTSRPQVASITHAPTFVFDREGLLHSIEFDSRNGDRESVTTVNCQKKLELTLKQSPTGSQQNLVDSMAKLNGDPVDYITANRMCFDYHPGKDGSQIRAKVKR